MTPHKNVRRSLLLCAALCLPALGGCDSTEPQQEGPGEEELITRVVVLFQGTNGVPNVQAAATNDNGVGSGAGLTVETLRLQAGGAYTGTIELFDGDAEITAEIRSEDEAHQFFYTVTGAVALNIDLTVTDRDANGLPVGLAFNVTVDEGVAGTGSLRIQLSHYDNETKDGARLSEETDLDFEMPVSVNL